MVDPALRRQIEAAWRFYKGSDDEPIGLVNEPEDEAADVEQGADGDAEAPHADLDLQRPPHRVPLRT